MSTSTEQSLQKTLTGAFGAMLVLTLLVAGLGAAVSAYFADSAQRMYDDNVRSAVDLAEAQDALWRLRYGLAQFLVMGADDRKRILDEESGLYDTVNGAMRSYQQGRRTPEELAAAQEFREVFSKYSAARPRWFQLQMDGKADEAAAWRAQTTLPFGAAMVRAMDKLIVQQREVAKRSKEQVDSARKTVLPSFGIAAVLLSLALAWFASRRVLQKLGGVSSALAQAASEFEAAASEQEATVSQQAAGVEEVSRTVASLAESASHIAATADGVLANAERSRATTEVTATRIAELSKHTARMGELLESIREIADRTDLLALNASLEASRAGEEGKSFALLAGEMRKLAERVTLSVQDVKTLVGDVRSSGTSTVMATEEAKKLADGTTESARQISLVTTQQRTATAQVADTMRNITGALTQVLAAARQARSGATSLRTQAVRLSAFVGERQGPDAPEVH